MPVPFRKRARRWLRARLIRLIAWEVSFFPVALALACGRLLGKVAYRLAPRPRQLTHEHLALAFPELSGDDRETLARGVFVGLGEHLFENLVIRKIDRRLPEWVAIDDQSLRHLETAYASGDGVIVTTGHLGNWELAARALTRRGFSVTALARRSHDAGLGQLMERLRREGGIDLLYRGEPGNAKKILRQLRSGSSLFMLVDQDLDERSVYVPFFGRDARSVRGPAELALKSGAHLLVGTVRRAAPGQGHALTIQKIEALPSGDKDADVLRVTAEIQATLEAAIREAPAQWVWFHRRWYRRPEDETNG